MAGGRHSSASGKRGKRSSGLAPALVVVVLILVVAALVAAFFLLPRNTEEPGEVATGTEVTVTVPDGAGAGQIGELLKEAKLVPSVSDFLEAVEEKDASSQLKPGTYKIVGGASEEEIIDILVSGKTGNTLTVPEGYTVKQVAALVHDVCGISANEFETLANTAKDFEVEYAFLADAYNGSMEGFLFPSTYEVPFDATASDVIRLMLDTYAKQVESLDLKRAAKKNLDAYDVLTLASIVEKEAGSSKDMDKISSVFYNRMHAKMNLGSDVTTGYGLNKDPSELTNSDLASDNPYNTRNPNILGLPPSPICNPGMTAIEAAAHPADTDYLYFFYSSKKEKVMFYKTLDEFNAAKAKYM